MKKNLPDKTEILLYTSPNGDVRVEVFFQDETVWLTINKMAELFQVTKQNISYHIQNIYQEKELDKNSTVKEILTVQFEGGREIKRNLDYYNLDSIIALGYRVNSFKATQFRIWATKTLREYIITDVNIAKNYLSEKELKALNRIVTMYLDFAELQAERQIPMKMTDWTLKLDGFLKFNDYEILKDAGKVTAAVAKQLAEEEYEKYRVIQDMEYESDFDLAMKKYLKDSKKK